MFDDYYVFDCYKGVVEQACPLCSWFGIVGAYKKHLQTHGFTERFWYRLVTFFTKTW